MRRVVITGAGTWNGFGAGVQAFLEALRNGRCAIGDMTLFSTSGFRTHRAAVAPTPEVGAAVPASLAARLSRSDRMALAAAREAWQASGIGETKLAAERIAVVVGGTTGGMLEAEDVLRRRRSGELGRMPVRGLVAMPVGSTADVLAHVFGCDGARNTAVTACSSSANSLGLAADLIQDGRADAALAGGTDAHCKMTYAGFNALQALAPDVCRPFDRRRAGLSLGEGAAMFVLEEEAHARRRGAAILAEFGGYGMSADAHHMTAPEPDGRGAVLAMRRALREARIAADAVEYVNAHGTGTPQNDPIETRAIKEVFGEHARRLAVSSTKSQIGHCLGAAGAIEALATVLALHHGFLPPTIHLEEPDPECDLDYVPGASREQRVSVAVSNSYGFGGNNTSVVLTTYA
ncbi:MAG: beta-ketoacyl-[acyl-carrier-protein] synthase family protein [Candidatus Binatia bacterium]